jgi:hypothetical protein
MRRVIWLNGTVGAGKSSVGRALAAALPGAGFFDGDDFAGAANLPPARRWRVATEALLRIVARPAGIRTLVIAYPLGRQEHRRLRAVAGRARMALVVVTLATPLRLILRGRGTRRLDAQEQARARAMRSQGYHRRRFARLTLPNAQHAPAATAAALIRRLRWG